LRDDVTYKPFGGLEVFLEAAHEGGEEAHGEGLAQD